MSKRKAWIGVFVLSALFWVVLAIFIKVVIQ
ncbi:YmiA family putative membrane protein [Salmonella enterica]|nr:YmiA family putative membrane protein [Salmonella enterica]